MLVRGDVGRYMLGNASSLPFGHVGLPDEIKKGRFSVVYVTHHSNDGGTKRGSHSSMEYNIEYT
jgi:hypothetical protein